MLEYSVDVAYRNVAEERMMSGDTAARTLASPAPLREKESPDRQHRLLLKPRPDYKELIGSRKRNFPQHKQNCDRELFMAMLEVFGRYHITHEDDQGIVIFTHTKAVAENIFARLVILMERSTQKNEGLQVPYGQGNHSRTLIYQRLYVMDGVWMTCEISLHEDISCKSHTTAALKALGPLALSPVCRYI
jgi:hypothetical protein